MATFKQLKSSFFYKLVGSLIDLAFYRVPLTKKMNKVITILGFGNIGKQICSSLISMKEYAFTINIMELPDEKTGAILDFQHALDLFPNHKILLNNQAAFNASNFIFHAAGGAIPKGKSRLEVVEKSIAITEEVFKDFEPLKDCKIIVISNPVDIIAFITQKITGLPNSSIIGTGTFLDSIRMNYYVKKSLPQQNNIDCILLGEHGETTFVSTQFSKINNENINLALKQDQISALLEQTKGAAKEIKQTEDATIYGVSFCAIKILEALLEKKKTKMPVSTQLPAWLCKTLNTERIFLSLYSEINQDGATFYNDYNPNKEELQQLENSYKKLIPLIPKKYL